MIKKDLICTILVLLFILMCGCTEKHKNLDGSSCSTNDDCQSRYCNNNICCSSGKCCLTDNECPSGYFCRHANNNCERTYVKGRKNPNAP